MRNYYFGETVYQSQFVLIGISLFLVLSAPIAQAAENKQSFLQISAHNFFCSIAWVWNTNTCTKADQSNYPLKPQEQQSAAALYATWQKDNAEIQNNASDHSASTNQTIVNKYITQPVIERTFNTTEIVRESGITNERFEIALNELRKDQYKRDHSLPNSFGSAVAPRPNVWGLSQKIDNLGGVTITNSSISGSTGTFTNLTVSGSTTLTGALTGVDLTLSGDFGVDADTFFVDSTNNFVGLGTNTPTRQLTLVTPDRDPIIKFERGSTFSYELYTRAGGQFHIAGRGDGNGGAYGGTSDLTDLLTIHYTGNLSSYGYSTITGNTLTLKDLGTGGTDTDWTLRALSSAGSGAGNPQSAFGIATGGLFFVKGGYSGDHYMGITDAGNVGIGDVSPDHKLDVAGNIGLDASGYINFGDTDGSSGYGLRDNAGVTEIKNSGGEWARALRRPRVVVTVAASNSIDKNAADYVADGTGDEVQIQAAIDSLSGGGIVQLLEGTFTLTNGVEINHDDDGIWIEGAGMRRTILTGALGDMEPFIELHSTTGQTLSNVRISDLSIDATNHAANTALPGGGMISYDEDGNLEYIKIENVAIDTNANQNSAIMFYNDSGLIQYLSISGTIINNKDGNGNTATRAYGIDVRKPTEHLWIQDNRIYLYNDSGGINSYNAIAVYGGTRYFHVNNNTVVGEGHTPIAVSPGSYGEITGNIVDGSSVAGEGGIEIEYKEGHGATTTSHHVVVANNIVYSSNWGIYTHDRSGGTLPPHNIAINGNNISGSDVGIRLEYGTDITVYGNHYENNTVDFSKDVSVTTKAFAVESSGYVTGNLGIGTTTPSAQLHTTGAVRFATFGAGTLQTDASGNLTVSSDIRLKDVQGEFGRSIGDLLGLEPITYNWNEISGFDTSTLYAGFSAQNVKDSIPEAVGEDKHGFLTLSDRTILAVIVNAVKETWAEISGLKSKANAFEIRLAALEAQIAGVGAANDNQPVLQSETPAPPTIEILGNNPAEISTGTDYSDLGATATDANGNDLTVLVFLNGQGVEDVEIDTATSTTHIITYRAQDGDGQAVEVTRKVIVGGSETAGDATEEPEELVESEIENGENPTAELNSSEVSAEQNSTQDDESIEQEPTSPVNESETSTLQEAQFTEAN